MKIQASKIKGTIYGYEKFLKSPVWKDMKTEMEIWLAMARSEYREAKNMEEVAKIQGREEAIEWLMQLPEILLEAQKANDEN